MMVESRLGVLSRQQEEPRSGRYAWYTGDLATGRITASLPLVQTSWSAVLNDSGALGGSLPLGSGDWPDIASQTAPAKSFLAVSYIAADGTETFRQAGPIWARSYREDGQLLTIGAAGVWSYYDHRKALDSDRIADSMVAASSLSYSGLSLGTIAKRLVSAAHAFTSGSLPIVLPDDLAGTSERNYPGYQLSIVGDLLRNLTSVQGGPDIAFRPRRKETDPRYLEWVMLVGTTTTPQVVQSGADHVWTHGLARSAVKGIDTSEDGAGMGSRAWAAGEGELEGRPITHEDNTALTDAGYPLLEVHDTSTDTVSETATLTAHAKEALAEASGLVDTWTVQVDRDSPPHAGLYDAGDWASFRIGKHPLITAGTHRRRIVAIDGDDTATIRLTLAPVIGD